MAALHLEARVSRQDVVKRCALHKYPDCSDYLKEATSLRLHLVLIVVSTDSVTTYNENEWSIHRKCQLVMRVS